MSYARDTEAQSMDSHWTSCIERGALEGASPRYAGTQRGGDNSLTSARLGMRSSRLRLRKSSHRRADSGTKAEVSHGESED